jgi:chromosome segregation ATPase
VDTRAVDDLRALRRSDEELADAGHRLEAREAAVAAIRARAEEIEAFFAALPDEEARRRAAIAEAERDLERRREDVAAAERALAEADGDEVRERADRAAARGREHVRAAEARLDRARAAGQRLAAEAAELEPEIHRLEREATALAEAAPDLPSPGTGTRALVEWASHAHAELFVARSQVDRRRDQVIREAGELASSILGEPVYGSTPAQALARVERSR